MKAAKAKLDGANADIENIKAERNHVRKSIEEEKAALQELFIKQNTARMNVVTAEERKTRRSRGLGHCRRNSRILTRRWRDSCR